MRHAAICALLLILAACESDVMKLERLELELTTSCRAAESHTQRYEEARNAYFEQNAHLSRAERERAMFDTASLYDKRMKPLRDSTGKYAAACEKARRELTLLLR